jgi:anti-anti-sigma regulatory factor
VDGSVVELRIAELEAENLRLRAELSVDALDSEKFRVLFEHASDGLLILGVGGILDCNAAAIAMLRARGKAEVLRVHPAVLSPEVQPDGRRSLEKSVEMDRTAHLNGVHRFEWTHRRMTGEDFPVEVTLTPVNIPGERVLLVTWRELTAIKAREAELAAKLAVIAEQQAEIEMLSLPVLAVWDGVLMIPVLGRLDPASATRLMETALTAATQAQARAVILDLTGLARVDGRTAHDLFAVVGALGLIGAQGILVGIGPAIAEAMIAADVPMPRVRVFASVRAALEVCVRGSR